MFGTNELIGKKFFKEAPADSLFVTSMFFTLQGEGPYSGSPALFVRLAKCNLTCSFCFVPSTKIVMGNGKKKRIDEVEIGDMVMSWSGDKFEPKRVTKLYTSTASRLVKVTSSGEPVWVTPEHPFLTSNRGWVNAEHLLEGDKLVHWSNSSYMTLFNPQFDPANHGSMSPDAKSRASANLQSLWQDPEFREKGIARMRENNPMKDPEVALKAFLTRENQEKTQLEINVEKICEGLPITFVGNGDLVVSHKIPDFVVDGQKKLIEVWADDSSWVKKSPRDAEWQRKRKELFAKEGYDTLFIPIVQADMRIADRHKIREKVAEFVNNGRLVKKVEFVNPDDGRGWARLYGSKDAARVVHNFEVEDNHTYIANNCVVHNCDTYFDDGDWLTFEEIEAKMYLEIDKFWAKNLVAAPKWAVNTSLSGPVHPGIVLVITGGEPLLQENVTEFMERQLPLFKAVQVESNGIPTTDVPKGVTLVCSPKCAEKGGVAIKYLAPSRTILERADCLKFVMSADPDSPYHDVPQWALDWKEETGKEIYCSPMNIYNSFPQQVKLLRAEKGAITMAERSTVDEVISWWAPGLLNLKVNQANHEYVGQYCMKHGLRAQMQTHLFMSLA